MLRYLCIFYFFFFNDTATTEIYTLSLHDALPICRPWRCCCSRADSPANPTARGGTPPGRTRAEAPPRSRSAPRSEEHTSELQSRSDLVCRLLLEKKKREAAHIPQPVALLGSMPQD